MRIRATAKTQNGAYALRQLYLKKEIGEKIFGIKKTVEKEEPFTLIISSAPLLNIPAQTAKSNKFFVDEVTKNWDNMLENKGAKKEDYDIEIIQ
ncbi:hypothetical protein KY315_02495 [Candidatus Woesearchaeota archaeon]|nr:hypothetical protein [Candidatus Woesearchaeota archaeon]